MMRTIRGSFWKHPRLSGEDRPREALEHPGTETPPLTRGRPHSAQSRLRSPWKHPQLRGEDFCTCPTLIALIETPPLTRGRLRLVGRASRRARNTPAYAGKTVMEGVFPPDRTKHPRLRGEDIPVPGDVPTIGETPPLTRGRPDPDTVTSEDIRNTPAYAGKTSSRRLSSSPCRKHPRLRGEDSPVWSEPIGDPETPPLTRGRPGRPSPSGVSFWKHPRLRGEDRKHRSCAFRPTETTPLTRGRHDARAVDDGDGRKHPRLRGEDCKAC